MISSLYYKSEPVVKAPTAPPTPNTQKKNTHRKHSQVLLGCLVLGLGIVGVNVVQRYSATSSVPNGVQLSGRIEGYPTYLNVGETGRIESLMVREGDRVQKGDVIAQLNDDDLQAQLDGAMARISAAQQQQQQAQLQIQVVLSQINAAQLTLQQSMGEANGRISRAEADLAAAEAHHLQAQALRDQANTELAQARIERDRMANLQREGAVSRQQFDQAQAAVDMAQASIDNRNAAIIAAQRQVNAAQGTLMQAQTSNLNPAIQTTQLDTLNVQLNIARSQLATAQAEVANAEASHQGILNRIDELTIVSPLDGVVVTRSTEPGMVVTPGTTLVTILDPNDVYLRGFIPEGQMGQVRLGQTANVYLDSNPSTPLVAEVVAVDSQASFTPENIYFQEDRVQQVFGVNLKLDNPKGFAKPGMPADADISLDHQWIQS